MTKSIPVPDRYKVVKILGHNVLVPKPTARVAFGYKGFRISAPENMTGTARVFLDEARRGMGTGRIPGPFLDDVFKLDLEDLDPDVAFDDPKAKARHAERFRGKSLSLEQAYGIIGARILSHPEPKPNPYAKPKKRGK